MYGRDTWDNNPCTVGIHEITIHVWSRYMRKQSTYPTVHGLLSHVSWPYMDCYLMYPDRTWIVISCIPTVHGLLSHVSRPYMDCYLVYPDRIWIAITCILTVHGLLSHVSRPYMDCYLMYPDRTWIVFSWYGRDTRDNNPCTVRMHEIAIHVRSGYMR
jgi:hypothetical protein